MGETVFRRTGLRIQLKKVNEMPFIDGIWALPQISELFGHAISGEDRDLYHLHVDGKVLINTYTLIKSLMMLGKGEG